MSDGEGPRAKRMVPIREGVLRLPETPDGKPVLLGSRCPNCGASYFPERRICIACGHKDLEETSLSQRGKLWTYTIARQTPPGSWIEAPYAIGVVELPEKVAVRAVLTDVDLDAIKVGMDMEITLAKMREDQDGNDIVSYKFRPV
jgi:uncharacterized OB-fold protein